MVVDGSERTTQEIISGSLNVLRGNYSEQFYVKLYSTACDKIAVFYKSVLDDEPLVALGLRGMIVDPRRSNPEECTITVKQRAVDFDSSSSITFIVSEHYSAWLKAFGEFGDDLEKLSQKHRLNLKRRRQSRLESVEEEITDLDD